MPLFPVDSASSHRFGEKARLSVNKAVFLDRDGVLNHLVDRGDTFRFGNKPIRWTAPFCLEELQLKPFVQEALELMEQKGYLRIMVTNQPDVATGNMDLREFVKIMGVFRGFPFTALYACMHHPNAGCRCRKPLPGMLTDAQRIHQIDVSTSYMVGDMETDVMAGKAAGVRTIRLSESGQESTQADHQFTNILEVAQWLP